MGRMREFVQEFHPIVHSLLVGTVFARAASSMSMPFLAIYLSKHTSMDPMMIGFTIGAGSLAGTVGGFVGGTLSDLLGRRRVMLGALYVWTFVFFGFAVGSSAWFFLLLNLLSGLCRSFYEPVSQALMADLTVPEKRLRVFSLRYTAINIGVAIGPIIGAYLGFVAGALPFLVTSAVYLVYVLSLQYLLHRFGIKKIEGQKKEHVTFASACNVVIRDVALRLFVIGGVFGAIGYSQMTITLSQFVEQKFADGVQLFSILMSVNAIVVVALQMPLAKWAEKRTPLQSIMAGNLMYALGDIGFACANSWTLFILSMVVFTIGEILVFPASNVFIDRLAVEELRGAYFGAQSFSNLGHFLGPWLGGYLLAHYGGSTMFVTVAAISLSGTLFYWGGQRRYEANTGKQMMMARAE